MTQKKSNALKGYSCSLIGAVANSQYFFVLKVLVLSAAIVSNNGDSKFIFPFCLFIVIEFFNLVFNIFAFGGTKFLDSIKTMFTYDGFFLFCCGIIGGPLGAACNLLCVFYAGPIIGILFSLLPALATTIFNRIFLKDRITTMAWFSIFLTLAGVVGYSCFDLFDANSLNINTDKILIGVIFGFLNCFFWGLEVTILDFVYRKGAGKIKPVSQPVALNIKFTTSVLTALLVIPLLDVSSSTNYDLGYYYLKSMFLEKNYLL
ncbi:hypothetical protein JTY60_01925 [symbiont of Argiope bruennichi]|uniref:hypothetical protein n=1 Tax=symbiont of Argiope bruennichi TaxID=2810479 RepID=UPI003DA43F14